MSPNREESLTIPGGNINAGGGEGDDEDLDVDAGFGRPGGSPARPGGKAGPPLDSNKELMSKSLLPVLLPAGLLALPLVPLPVPLPLLLFVLFVLFVLGLFVTEFEVVLLLTQVLFLAPPPARAAITAAPLALPEAVADTGAGAGAGAGAEAVAGAATGIFGVPFVPAFATRPGGTVGVEARVEARVGARLAVALVEFGELSAAEGAVVVLLVAALDGLTGLVGGNETILALRLAVVLLIDTGLMTLAGWDAGFSVSFRAPPMVVVLLMDTGLMTLAG